MPAPPVGAVAPQVRDVIIRLIKLRPRYPTIADELLNKLERQLMSSHDKLD